MECRKAEYLLPGYLDGELDLLASYDFERHVEKCPACTERLARDQSLRARFSESSLHFRAPPDLRGKIQKALLQTIPVAVGAPPAASRSIDGSRANWRNVSRLRLNVPGAFLIALLLLGAEEKIVAQSQLARRAGRALPGTWLRGIQESKCAPWAKARRGRRAWGLCPEPSVLLSFAAPWT